MEKKTLNLNCLSAKDTILLNKIAWREKNRYTEYVDECCRKYGDNYLFWATPFSSRNIFNDNTFMHICHICLVKELIGFGGSDYDRIITGSKCEYLVLKGILPPIVSLEYMGASRIDSARLFFDRVKSAIVYFAHHICYVIHSPKENDICSEQSAIVIGFAVSSDFEGYHYNERYMPGIDSYHDVVFLPQVINNSSKPFKCLLNQMKNCTNVSFLYNRKLARISDLWEIVRYWLFTSKIQNKRFDYAGIDISPIIKESMACGKTSGPSLDGLMMRKILYRLSKLKGNIKNFILWYEGRSLDVMNSASIHEFFPEANCVGYEGYPLTEIGLSEFVSDYQYHSGHSPSVIAVPSEAYGSEAHQFCRDIPLIYAPLLRNQYTLQSPATKSRIVRKILIVLPYYIWNAKEILDCVDEYVRASGTDSIIMIKNHPIYSEMTVEDYGCTNLSFAPEYVSGNLNDCLADVDIAIASMTSSSLEVLFSGTPLIIMVPRGQFGFTSLPEKVRNQMCSIVYDAVELSNAIDQIMDYGDFDNSTLEDLLVPKTRENVMCLFI